jgi:hypothetical protein
MDHDNALRIPPQAHKVFDSDGNPIEAAVLLALEVVDGVACLIVRGGDFYAREIGTEINAADDVRFCIPISIIKDLPIGLSPDTRMEEALTALASALPRLDPWRSAADFMQAAADTLDLAEIPRPDHYEN